MVCKIAFLYGFSGEDHVGGGGAVEQAAGLRTDSEIVFKNLADQRRGIGSVHRGQGRNGHPGLLGFAPADH